MVLSSDRKNVGLNFPTALKISSLEKNKNKTKQTGKKAEEKETNKPTILKK